MGREKEVVVRFFLKNGGVGYHPRVPPGVVYVHPSTIPLFKGFFTEGDLVLVNGSNEPLEIIPSNTAFPPIFLEKSRIIVGNNPDRIPSLLESSKVIYVGGVFTRGDAYLPPLVNINEASFRKLVSVFKEENPDPLFLSLHGIPPLEKYMQEVGPFFGYHVPNAVQLADEQDWQSLFKEWGGATLPLDGYLEIALYKHKRNRVLDTGINGIYPVRTPYPVFVCPNGCRGPFEVCPICGERGRRVKVCPLCGRIYDEGEERCSVDGSELLERIPHDPSQFFNKLKGKYGDVGDITVSDGEPEDPKKPYLRKKTNLTVSKYGVIEMDIVPFPGKRTLLPRNLVDVVLRIYRFLGLLSGRKDFPESPKDIVGRKMVMLDNGRGFVIEIEGIGGSRFELREELFYSLPQKDVRLAVYEDVLENGRNIKIEELNPGGKVDYSSYPFPSIFETGSKQERLLEIYMEVVDLTGANPSMAIPLFYPILKDMELRSRRTPLYRCVGCGLESNRLPLNGRCPRCGEKFELQREPDLPDLEELADRFSSNQKVYEFLMLFKKRFYGKHKQKSLLELF